MKDTTKKIAMAELDDDALESVAGGNMLMQGGASAIASGSFTSNTGTQMDIKVTWSFVEDNGVPVLTVNVDCVSYGMNYTGTANAVTIKYGSYTMSATPGSFNTSSQSANSLAELTFRGVPKSGMLEVSWNFNGSYNGVALSTVTASQQIGY